MARMVLVRTTLPDEAAAHRMAERLVDDGLAVCVHVGRIYSVYRWKGQREGETEWMLEARTRRSLEGKLREAIEEGHPYELPIVESAAWTVNRGYLEWARSLG